jgi:uncharacterized SAM-binding protein YcdF (DUF218 family)
MRHAISLYDAGLANQLILSGGMGRYPPEEAEVMRSVAAGAGVPEESLLLDSESRSTIESIRRAHSVMRDNGWTTAIVVSDPFHIFRALLMARDEGLTAFGSPAENSPTHTIPRQRHFYTLREIVAVLWYRLQ